MSQSRLRTFHWVILFIGVALAGDAAIARSLSPSLTQKILTVLSRRAESRITLEHVRFHPLFLAFSADNLEVFDPAFPKVRVLYSRRVKANMSLLSLLRGKFYVSSLILDQAEMKVVKDQKGILNVEKILYTKGAESGKSFHGSKHKDWFFNLYERFKYDVRHSQAEKPLPEWGYFFHPRSVLFEIGTLEIKKGRLILTDRQTKPLFFNNINVSVSGLEWSKEGAPSIDAIFLRGGFKNEQEGRFQARFFRKRGQIHLQVNLNQVDLKMLRPLYRNTVPVYFERGFLSLQSDSRLSPENLDSKNRLKIEAHKIKSTTDWSPESQIFLTTLNRHPKLIFNFTISGDPERPSLKGVEESLIKNIQKDFNPAQLLLIQKRIQQELEKVA